MFFQARWSKRVGVEAAIHRKSERRQTIGAGDPYFVFGGANLLLKLGELGASRNIVRLKLLKLCVERHG